MKNANIQLTGAGDKEKRRDLDFYPTPPEVTIALMDFLKLEPCIVWEPACGEGDMVKVIASYGHIVMSSDIRNEPSGDFFEINNTQANAIITNPPFNLSERFILKALGEADIVAMLLKSQYWHSKKRLKLFNEHKPAYVLPLTWRPDFLFKERESSKKAAPTMEVCWTVWIKGKENTQYIPLPKPNVEKKELTAQWFPSGKNCFFGKTELIDNL